MFFNQVYLQTIVQIEGIGTKWRIQVSTAMRITLLVNEFIDE